MHKRHKPLEQIFEEHFATYEALIDTHEKLKEAYSSFLSQKESIPISNIRVIYDILDESFFATIVVMATNPSCSTTPSSTSDGLTCDSTLIVENETVKKEVNELN